MIENKIGDIITLPDGRKAEVMEATNHLCGECFFNRLEEKYNFDCVDFCGLYCAASHRTDHKNIIYKEIK